MWSPYNGAHMKSTHFVGSEIYFSGDRATIKKFIRIELGEK